ncbi:hypothetical protein PI126_g8511 [Phytophthora idaei]|nr:hypothetical protein PI126_g8511 [Phytophthora idaei]
MECKGDCPISMEPFVKWMTTTPDLDHVGKIAAMYPICYKQSFLLSRSPTVLQKRASEVVDDANFVIPIKLMKRINSALLNWMSQQGEHEDLDPSPDAVVPAQFLASDMGGFSM